MLKAFCKGMSIKRGKNILSNSNTSKKNKKNMEIATINEVINSNVNLMTWYSSF